MDRAEPKGRLVQHHTKALFEIDGPKLRNAVELPPRTRG